MNAYSAAIDQLARWLLAATAETVAGGSDPAGVSLSPGQAVECGLPSGET